FVTTRVLVPEGADDGVAIAVDATSLHAHLVRIATAPALVDNHLGAIPAAGLHGDSTVHVMQVQPAARLHHLAPLQSHHFLPLLRQCRCRCGCCKASCAGEESECKT